MLLCAHKQRAALLSGHSCALSATAFFFELLSKALYGVRGYAHVRLQSMGGMAAVLALPLLKQALLSSFNLIERVV
jgi:hypothetical protein